MSASLRIVNALRICPERGALGLGALCIVDGRIADDDAGAEDLPSVDAGGRLLIPGLVELAAALREPGLSRHADIASECRAALAGGIVRLAASPDTRPVLDAAAQVRLVQQRAAALSDGAQVSVLGALTQGLGSEALSEMATLQEAGCVGLANAGRLVADSNLLRRALQYAASLDLCVHLHPGDPWLSAGACVHEGRVAARLGLPGQPASAEAVGLARDLALVRDTGARVHFCRISSAESVELLARAKADGLPVSADVSLFQLYLSELDLLGFNAQCHLRPPLRTPRDRDALREALAAGVIDALCCDHQPLNDDAKLAPLPETEPGASGLDTALGLGLKLVEDGLLDLPTWLDRAARAPARILGLPGGSLAVGNPADLILVDAQAHWRVDPARFRSRGRNTPFAGWTLPGRVLTAWLGGERRYAVG